MGDCGKGCAKMMLILFNVIFLLTGLALFAVGLWIRFDKRIWDIIGFATINSNDPYIEYGAYLLIAVGGFIILTSAAGCCGAITERRFLLGLYIFILTIVLLAEIAGAVLFIIYHQKIKEELYTKANEKFLDSNKNYGPNGNWSAFASAMNLVQDEFDCCGLKGPADYVEAPTSVKACTTAANSTNYPCSCFPKLSGIKKNGNDLIVTDVNNTMPYAEGCETKFLDFFEKYSIIFIGMAIGFACLEVFGLIYAICLYQLASRKSKYTE